MHVIFVLVLVDPQAALQIQASGDPPAEFLCPLSLCLMRDPWTTQVGSTYEKAAIQKWLHDKRTDPMTNQMMQSTKLVPNQLTKGMIIKWLEDHLEYAEQG